MQDSGSQRATDGRAGGVRRSVALGGVLVLLMAGTAPARAQTHDQARLIINVFGGFISGSNLWRVNGQPLYDYTFGGEPYIDTLTLRRTIRANPMFGARFLMFPGEHVGYFGEAFLLGMGYDDTCGRTYESVSPRNAQVCESINRNQSPSSAVQVGGGVLFRTASQRRISPYARVGAGVGLSSRSPLAMDGTFNSPASDNQQVIVEVFAASNRSQLHPVVNFGAGFTTPVGRGYQMRWEVRDNIVGVNTASGPTSIDGEVPESSLRFRHRFSIEVGFDVVLERRPGRRY